MSTLKGPKDPISAFYTVDPNNLLGILLHQLGFRGTAFYSGKSAPIACYSNGKIQKSNFFILQIVLSSVK